MHYIADFVFFIAVQALFLVVAALVVVDTRKHTKQLYKAMKKLRGSDNDRN